VRVLVVCVFLFVALASRKGFVDLAKSAMFMRLVVGARKLRLRQPKYDDMWDAEIMISNLHSNDFWVNKI